MTDYATSSMATEAVPPRPATRRPELDVLTTLIVFSLIFFHTLGIFTGYQGIVYPLKNQLATILLSFVVVSEFIWIMPVMMFVAGIAIYHSLKRRGAAQFVQERLLRLGVPFLTGLVLANPPQIYYALRLRSGLQESFLRFYPRYWNIRFSLLSFPYFLEPAGAEQTFNVIHLWFLIFLLVYTLLLVPLFIYLGRPASG
jgi:glucan biosynthesis protein C